MKRLTKKKALEITVELWEWLAENPGKEKAEWPGWDKKEHMLFWCPICEYEYRCGLSSFSMSDCNDCLIYWRKEPNLGNRCTYPDSPFERWANTRANRTRKKYALEIVKLAKDALENLKSSPS